jgi:NADH dehydrogenase
MLGGTGFVGAQLAARLARDGHWLTLPSRDPDQGQALRVLPTVQLLKADIHDPAVLDRLLEGMDAVVNLVGILNEHGHDTFQRVHADLAAKVVAAMQAGRIRRLLHMSALGADVHGPSAYLRSKGAAENHLRAAAAHLDFTIFRPSVIFGPGDSLTNRFAGLLRLSHGWMPLARAHARFAPIYVGDVAEAFARALLQRETFGQTYELGGPDVVTLEQLVRLSAQASGLPCHILRVPDALGRLQAAVLGLLPGKPMTLDNFRSLTRDSVCAEDGCARLGLHPRAMLEVLPTYLGAQAGPVNFGA